MMRVEHAGSLGEDLALGLKWVEVRFGDLGEIAGGWRVSSEASVGVGEGKTEIEDEVNRHDDENGEVSSVKDVFWRF